MRTTGEGPVNEALVEFAGTEGCNLKNVPAGDVAVTVGDTGIAEGAGVGVGADDVGTGVLRCQGLIRFNTSGNCNNNDEKTDQ